MKGTLTYTRNYNLGNYSNIRVGGTIEDIPQEVLMNEEAVETLRMLQFIRSEKSFLEYVKLHQGLQDLSLDKAIEELEEKEIHTVENFKNIIEGE